MDALLRRLFHPLAFHMSEFRNKFSDHLSLTIVRRRYCTSNLLNSIAHSAIRLTASGLFTSRRRGLSVNTMIVWAWKYGFSLRAAITKAKASFSIDSYLFSMPLSSQLV